MDSYSVSIKPSARKELESLHDPLLSRLVPKVEALADTPRPAGCKKLKGYEDQWRIRVGNYRIVYLIDDSNKAVVVTRIAHRSEVHES